MTPNKLELYQRYEIDLGKTVEIRQFAGVQTNTEGQMIFIFIPWVVDQNPERNRNQTLRITPELLYQVTLYQRV